jgi:hypothetical protein
MHVVGIVSEGSHVQVMVDASSTPSLVGRSSSESATKMGSPTASESSEFVEEDDYSAQSESSRKASELHASSVSQTVAVKACSSTAPTLSACDMLVSKVNLQDGYPCWLHFSEPGILQEDDTTIDGACFQFGGYMLDNGTLLSMHCNLLISVV